MTRLQKRLIADIDVWNEQELIIKFIALLIDKVDYDNTTYKAFANTMVRTFFITSFS
ncbi:MAG: hypothetical protein ACPG5B_03760 [Chitinophagales bacterium]